MKTYPIKKIIRAALKAEKMTQAEFARRVGYRRKSMNYLLSLKGGKDISTDKAQALLKHINPDLHLAVTLSNPRLYREGVFWDPDQGTHTAIVQGSDIQPLEDMSSHARWMYAFQNGATYVDDKGITRG